jgi:hypothetical protein
MKFAKTFKNDRGLARVAQWHMEIYGKHIDDKRVWMFAWAHCYVNGLPLPDAPKEGKTQRIWRAAPNRIDTMKRLLADSK